MTRVFTTVLVVAGVGLSAACHGARPAAVPPLGPSTVRIGEPAIWKLASKAPLPAYPAGSVTRGVKGTAVAFLRADTTGRIELAMVLEAPDDLIRAAVKTAVTQWELGPLGLQGSAEHLKVQGKITFYFDIRDGAPLVQGSPERVQERIAGGLFKPKAL